MVARRIWSNFSMKILIKNLKTGLFLTSERNWTARDKEALDFDNTVAAANYCCSHHYVHGMAIVFRFRNPRHDMTFAAH
jgi:hypothetical protein